MIKLFQVVLFLTPILSFGQIFNKADTLLTYPSEINAIVVGEIEKVYKVDFTGDLIGDYIIHNKIDHDGKVKITWLTSDFFQFRQISEYTQSYYFMRFINLDNDPEPEIYLAPGYSDGINYAFYDLNKETGE